MTENFLHLLEGGSAGVDDVFIARGCFVFTVFSVVRLPTDNIFFVEHLRQSIQKWTNKGCLPQILLGQFLNT